MLNDLNWQPLQIRRKNKRLIVFHKAVNQNSPVEIPDNVTQSTYSGTDLTPMLSLKSEPTTNSTKTASCLGLSKTGMLCQLT